MTASHVPRRNSQHQQPTRDALAQAVPQRTQVNSHRSRVIGQPRRTRTSHYPDVRRETRAEASTRHTTLQFGTDETRAVRYVSSTSTVIVQRAKSTHVSPHRASSLSEFRFWSVGARLLDPCTLNRLARSHVRSSHRYTASKGRGHRCTGTSLVLVAHAARRCLCAHEAAVAATTARVRRAAREPRRWRNRK